MKRKVISLALIVSIVLTGCGSTKSTSDGATSNNVVQLGGNTKEQENNKDIKSGGNIVIAESADPQNVNPL